MAPQGMIGVSKNHRLRGRVVHWAKYYPPHPGGMEFVVGSLAQGAADAGWAVSVVHFCPLHAPLSATVAGPVKLSAALARWTPVSQPLSWRYVNLAHREAKGADVVHLHAPNFLAILAAMRLPRRQPLVVHWHSDVIGKGWLGRLVVPLERWLLRRADLVICTSTAYAAASDRLGEVAAKVRVVPIGVPDPAARRACLGGAGELPPGIRAWLRGRRFVLTVGRLVPYKGFGVLVDAARRLEADTAVVIVGSGPQRGALAEQIDRLGLSAKVLLAGEQTGDALAALFGAASLFCLASVERSEAFGVVLVEAQAHGLPIVATAIAGSAVPWINIDGVTGLNVAPGDPAALANACRQLLRDEDRLHALGRAGRARFLEQFTQDRSIQAVLALYDELISGRPTTTRACAEAME